jgi:hypothetical protein
MERQYDVTNCYMNEGCFQAIARWELGMNIHFQQPNDVNRRAVEPYYPQLATKSAV